MENKFLEIIREQYMKADPPVWDDGLLLKNGSGHTWEVAELDKVHPGRDSASAYLLGKLLGKINEPQGIEILRAIESLQITDEKSERYGAFRWYREESGPIDTNAAFFTLLPLAILRLYKPELAGREETKIIDSMFLTAGRWFSHECKNPILFYTNKIISDGAMLIAIGKISGNDRILNESNIFLEKWLDYTENRGFGWGENFSPGYNGVVIQAITIIMKCLGDCEISKRFKKIEQNILETFRFQNGYEFVPAIRSYNIAGNLRPMYIINNLAQVENSGLADSPNKMNQDSIANFTKAMIIYGDRLYIDREDYDAKGFSNSREIPSSKVTCIMDDVRAYSWLGENGGLGSLNKFPVISGSYQHKGWGLGWQCFPVSAIVYGGQVSFLRFYVNDGVRMRCHPHKDKHSAYLDPALFSESFYPDVKTKCTQVDNTVIAIRSIEKLRNKVELISDSFDVQRFNGEILEVNANGYRWIALSYKNAVLCIASLLGIKAGCGEPDPGCIDIEKKDGNIRLVQTLFNGELKSLFDDRIYVGWIIHIVDYGMNPDEIKEYIESISIEETTRPDGQSPRTPEWYIHDTKVSKNGEEFISFSHDPYQ